MSFYYQRNVGGSLRRFDNSNNVIDLYSYGSGNTITNFVPTITGLVDGGYYTSTTINVDSSGGNPRVIINTSTGQLSFDTGTTGNVSYANANTSPLPSQGGPNDTIPNYYGLEIKYFDSGDNQLASAVVYFRVLAKTLTLAINVNAPKNKVYDGNNTCNLTSSDITVTGLIGTNTLSGLIFTSAIYDTKNVGTNKSIFLENIDFSLSSGIKTNYILPEQDYVENIHISGLEGDVTAKTLTPNFSVTSKTYDGTTSVSPSQITLVSVSGLISGDNSLLTYDASYNTANAGINNVNFINVVTSNSNYTVNSTLTVTGVEITQRTLSLTFTAANKVYNNTTTGSGVIILNGVQGSDTVSYSYSSITFDDKNVGTNKTVTINNIQLTNDPNNNYTIASSVTSTANITVRSLVPSYSVSSKEYDKTNNATVNVVSSGVYSGNDATINILSATFNSIYPASGIAVSATISLTGSDASNYSIDTTPDGLTGDITVRTVTSSWTVTSKVYDRTLSATVSGSLSNTLSGDVVTLTHTTSTFDSIHVGSGKTVTISGIALSGANSAYYTTSTSGSALGTITAKPLTANVNILSKVYNGNRTATVNYSTLSGVISGDTITLSSGISAIYDTASVGTSKTVNVTGISLSGTNNSNYSINSSLSTTGDITVKTLTPVVTITAKTYDKSLTANVGSTSLTGVVSGDILTLLYNSANYRTFTVGTSKDVDVSGLSLSGDVSTLENYSLSSNSLTTTGDITALDLSVTYAGPSKQFDGSNNITISGTLVGVLSGDIVTVSQTSSFVGASVGTGKQVNISSVTLGGTNSSNYSINSPPSTISGVITKKTITGSYSGVNKTYDSSNNATYTYTLQGLVTGYTNVIIASGSTAIFDDVNVGTRNVLISGVTLTSTDSGNYDISSTGSTQADITQKRLDISFSVPPRDYDGTDVAVFSGSLVGIISSENISFSNTSATYNNKNVGVNKVVTVTGITISGDISNYTINGTLTTSGTVNQKALTPLYTVQDKVYDQSNNAVVATKSVSGLIGLETVTLTETDARFTNVNVGSRSATITGIAISGAASSNYSIVSSASTVSNANINPVVLTATFVTTSKIYNGSTTATVTPSLSGILSGESSGVSVYMNDVVSNFDTKDVGTNKNVSITGITLTGAASSNYSVSSTNSSTGTISTKQLGISFTTTPKYYDASNNATVSGSLSDIVGSEVVSFTYSSSTFDNVNQGTGKVVTISGIVLSGVTGVISNYTVSGSVTTSGVVNRKILSSSWVTTTRNYNTTRSVTVTGTLSGVVGVEDVTVSGTGTIDYATVGTHSVAVTDIALGGTANDNYTLASTSATTTGTINTLNIYGYGQTKTYDGSRDATVTLSGVLSVSGTLDNVVVNNGLFDTLDASNNKTVTGTLSGSDSTNYNLVSIANADINKKQITGILVSRNYNNTNVVNVDLTSAAIETVGGIRDNVTATATLDSRFVGSRTATSTSLGGTKYYNYTLVLSSSSINITTKPIRAVTSDKIYDGNRTSILSLSGVEVVGGATDNVSISGSFNSRNIGSNVTISAYIYGDDSSNYTLNTDVSANITARDISGTSQNRIYDGTRNVTIVLNNTISGDNLSISGTTVDKNVESGKIVTPVLTGTDASNYNFVSVSNVDYTLRTLTATANNKTYNKDSDVTFTFSNLVSGDSVDLSGSFDTIDVSSNINVTLSGTIYGSDASNYNFTSTLFSANITKKDISGSCVSRAYNGSTSINVNLSGVISGDVVSCAGTLSNRRVGTRNVSGVLSGAQSGNYNLTGVSDVVISTKTITGAGQSKVYNRTTTAQVVLSGVETIDTSNVTITADYISFDVSSNSAIVNSLLAGSESTNYTLGSVSAGSITRKDISGTGLNKVYNANTTASVTLNGVESGDVANVSYTANFANKVVATNKTISGSLTGSRAFNYNLTGISNADITLLGITGTASNKTYNGTTVAVVTLTGVLSGDVVNASGIFNSRHVGNNIYVVPSLSGTDSANYNISNSGTISANISAKPITASSIDRIYDRTVNVTMIINNVETIDTSNVTLSGYMTDKLVGTSKTVSGSLEGSMAGNYNLTSIGTVNISKKDCSGTTSNKVYDSTTTATVTLNGIVSGDDVSGNCNFSDRDVSSNKPVTGSIIGADISNYNFISTSNANITVKPITANSLYRDYDRTVNVTTTLNNVEAFDTSNVTLSGYMVDKNVGDSKTVSGSLAGSRAFNYVLTSIANVGIYKKNCSGVAINKVYDGTTTATLVTPLTGIISGDVVGYTADFNTRHVGTRSVTGALTSTDAGNYNLTGISNADITRKTITGTAADKIYDRLTTASITLVGVETIDTSNVTVTGNFNTKDVSVNPKSVTGTISGSMSTNYTLGSVSSAMVNAKRLTGVTINKQYNGSRSATVLLNGVIEGDSVQVTANFSDKNAGDAKTVTGSIYGTDVNNYYIDGSSISVGNIEQKQVAVVLANKTYDGTTNASGSVQDLEVISGVTDNVLFNGYYISRDASDNVGGTGTLSGTDAYNYNISSIINGRIYQKSLTGTTRNKVYDGLNTATVDLSGVITIDSVVDNVNAVCTFASVRVGNNIVVAGSLSGTAANNYLLSSVSTANITPLTITATTSNKTYDGNNSASITIDGGQLKTVGGVLDVVTISGTFNNKNIGTSKLVTASIDGAQSSNYTLGTVSTANITQKDITAAGISRVYNGTTSVDLSLNNVVSGDVVTGTGTFASKYVGVNITISNGILSGTDASNYNLTTISPANITQKTVTGTGINKVYDSLLNASVTLSGVVSGDNLTISASFISKDVSSNSSISGVLGGTDISNYTLGAISPASITVKSITGYSDNKVYDKTDTASIHLNNVISGDIVNVTGTFTSNQVGTHTISSVILSGTDSNNYSINAVSVSGAIISTKDIYGIGNDKVYDGTVIANVTLSGVISGDVVDVTADFSDRFVDISKSITGTLSGTDSSNYNLVSVSNANITVKSVSATPNNKVYDRTNTATFTLSGIETIDISNVNVSGTWLRVTAGTGISAEATLSGLMAYNYNLSTVNNGDITTKTITGTAVNKVYDGLTTASVTLSGVISGDTVTISANFSSSDVSSNKPVTGTLINGDSANYTLSSISNANITAKSVTGTSIDRVYDRTTNVTVTLSGIVSGDNVTLSGTMLNKLIGTNKTVSGILEGTRAFNYLLSSLSTVNITALSLSSTTANKVYDGNNIASTTLSGVISGDTVTITSTFNNKTVGTSKTISGSLAGADAENYTVVLSTADITAKSITGTSVDRVYDRTTNVSVTLSGVVSGDVVTLSGSMTNKLVGINKTVSGFLQGTDASNYSLSSISNVNITAKTLTGTALNKVYDSLTTASVTLSGVISGDSVTISADFSSSDVSSNKPVTGTLINGDSGNYNLLSISNANITSKSITGTSIDRIYDRTTNVSVTLSGVEASDLSNVNVSGAMLTKLVGTGKSVTGTLSGTRAFNYLLSSVTLVNISELSINGIASNKVYDATTTAIVTLSGVISGDTVTASGDFDNKNIGSSKSVSGSLAGLDSGNYILSSISVADITTKTITGSSIDRVYDRTTNVTVTLSGVVSGDVVTLSGSMTNKLVGTNKTVTGSLQGTDASNYLLGSISNVNISTKTLTGTTSNKTYDGTTNGLITLSGVIVGDTVSVSGYFNNKNIGTNKSVSGVISGTDANNYTLSTVSNANITIRTLTGKGRDRTYDATTNVVVDLSNTIVGDDISATGVISSKNIGSRNVLSTTLLGVDASNYNISTVDNAVISIKSVTASANNKVYSASTQTDISLNNVESGDIVSGVANYVSRFVGNSVSIDLSSVVLSGLDSSNYHVSSVTAGNITPLTLTATGQNKVYDGTTTAVIVFNNLVIGDLSGEDEVIYEAYFNSRHVGVSKSISGILTGGAQVNNYTLGAISSANVTKLDISGTGYPKTYNGLTTASVLLNGVLAIDTSNVSVSADFNSRHVGNGKTISGSISGLSSGNYNLTSISNSNITALNVTGYSQDKVYDRTTTASVLLPDILPIDGSVTANANFINKDVSSNVNVSGSLVGTYASNYTVTFNTANITRKPLTALPADKVYDSSANTSFTLYGIISPDLVSAVGSYTTALVGSNKSASATLTGIDSHNYSLSISDISSGNVTAKPITGTGQNKVYDRNVTAQVVLNDVESIDVATLACDASFNNRLVGNSKPITGILTGASASNYNLTGISSANITVKSLIGNTSDKTYDGLNTASVSLSGIVAGDIVSVTAVFSDIFAETNKVVTGVISGTDVSNYVLSSVSRATINPKGITGTGRNKVYDGLRTAIVDISSELVSVNGVLDSVNVTALFADKNVGTGISISGSINGYHVSNYVLNNITSANITRKQVTAIGDNKVYDNNTDATTTLSGLIVADISNVIAPVGVFNNKNVDNNILISLTNSISGSESGNYTLVNNTTTANITPKPLNITWHVHNKTYDGTTAATVYYTSISGVFESDGVIFIENYNAVFDNAEAGFVKNVYITGIELTGFNAYNYYGPDATINGSVLGKGNNLFINNGLTINQNTGIYSEEHNVEAELNFDYVLSFNVSALTGVNGNMTNIFSTAHYIQNSQNADDVNIQLNIPNHNGMSNMTFNWNDINQQNIITVSRGRATVGFGTFFAEPVRFGETLLEIMAHKIFGHAQARSAISNDAAFNEHDVQLWDHLSSSMNNRTFQMSLFNQYITSGKYNVENLGLEGSDVYINQNFNFQGMTFDFPLFLNGSLLVDDQLVNETMVFRNGINVGGAQIVNGLYNIPILLRFHD